MTADGKVRIANACTNPDLFWALKGGGGGTFGVVTKMTLATHDAARELRRRPRARIQAKSAAAFRRLIGEFVRFYAQGAHQPALGRAGHVRQGRPLEHRTW